MLSSDHMKIPDINTILRDIDQRNERLYNEYLNKKTDYIHATKDIFHNQSTDGVIKLGDFEPINYNEKYSSFTMTLVEKAKRTGMLQLSGRGYTTVPEFVWTFGMPIFDKADILENMDLKLNNARKSFRSRRSVKFLPVPLEYLDLSNNEISKFIPKAPLEQLQYLKIEQCRLDTISEKILLFRNLKVLSLGNNELSVLPNCLGYLDNLEQLDVHGNKLNHLPNNICNILALKIVDICDNEFISISQFEVAIRNLEHLKASNNVIINVADGINLLSSMNSVDISNNKLTVLPDMCYMPHLQTFNSNFNNLVIFPNFSGCKFLKEIQLKSNRIQEIVMENLQFVPVEILFLNENKIQYVPENIHELSTLVSLDIRNNKIKSLPSQLALIVTLNSLQFADNPLDNFNYNNFVTTPDLLRYLAKQDEELMKKFEVKDKSEAKEKVLNIIQRKRQLVIRPPVVRKPSLELKGFQLPTISSLAKITRKIE